jgi:capsular exopolysaccharide synthesis family protein
MSDTLVFRQDAGSSPRKASSEGPAGGRIAFAPAIVTITRPDSLEAEAYRGLRTQVVVQHLNLGRRALAVCAATADDGSSVVAANLAVALSQAGLNTVLVDANLINPQVEALIRSPTEVPGLAEHLQSDAAPSEAIFGRVLPNLSIIYGGRAGSNSSELLAGARFKELIDFCLRNFDATIVDTPPANRSHGAQQISAIVGYSIVVAYRDKTFVKDVKTLIGQLEAGGVGVVGTVMCGA